MRLTIVNLFMQGERIRERTRSAGILARKPGELNPPYAGRRAAVEPEYRVGGVTMARRSCSVVVPATRLRQGFGGVVALGPPKLQQGGKQGPIRRALAWGARANAFLQQRGPVVPAFAGT